MTYYKTDVDGLVRDEASRAILNTDNAAYIAYKQRRMTLSEQDQLKKEVADLKSDINEIKSLLTRMLREQKL